ncbi:hypothetical protein GIB67_010455 [Kingdonia uniflora]|uniref:RNase H type-1 domain-containing protein n=1 Tax=Kingdonia uniflora TaxID=39325 RepID=A0A7J7MAG5_9MAGN|nr:hypothetical protein GIB67_010455 [Kingdonia uniflora]
MPAARACTPHCLKFRCTPGTVKAPPSRAVTPNKVVIIKLVQEIGVKTSYKGIELKDTPQARQVMSNWNLNGLLTLKQPIQHQRRPAPAPYVTVNTDATGSYPSNSITILELKAVSLVLADKRNQKKLCITTDSKTILSYLVDNAATPNWDAKHLVSRIKEAMKKIEDCYVIFNFRETNGAADFLVKLHPEVAWIEFTPSSFVQDLKDILHSERRGQIYWRI